MVRVIHNCLANIAGSILIESFRAGYISDSNNATSIKKENLNFIIRKYLINYPSFFIE